MSKEYVDKLQYLGYQTLFTAEGDYDLELRHRVCFADLFHCDLKKEHYELYLIRDKSNAVVRRNQNFCFLSKKELRKHIYLARRLFPFTYDVKEIKYDKMDAFKVIIDIDAPKFYHKYLLTWIRYTYEIPYNFILNDALRMKHRYLPKVSIPNLYVLCSNSVGFHAPDGNGRGHAIPLNYSMFLKEYELKKKLQALSELPYERLNDIYPTQEFNCKHTSSDSKRYSYMSYWFDEDDFEERAKIYLENYKTMTKK